MHAIAEIAAAVVLGIALVLYMLTLATDMVNRMEGHSTTHGRAFRKLREKIYGVTVYKYRKLQCHRLGNHKRTDETTIYSLSDKIWYRCDRCNKRVFIEDEHDV